MIQAMLPDDHYRLWKKDIGLMKEIGLKSLSLFHLLASHPAHRAWQGQPKGT